MLCAPLSLFDELAERALLTTLIIFEDAAGVEPLRFAFAFGPNGATHPGTPTVDVRSFGLEAVDGVADDPCLLASQTEEAGGDGGLSRSVAGFPGARDDEREGHALSEKVTGGEFKLKVEALGIGLELGHLLLESHEIGR